MAVPPPTGRGLGQKNTLKSVRGIRRRHELLGHDRTESCTVRMIDIVFRQGVGQYRDHLSVSLCLGWRSKGNCRTGRHEDLFHRLACVSLNARSRFTVPSPCEPSAIKILSAKIGKGVSKGRAGDLDYSSIRVIQFQNHIKRCCR